LGFESGLAIFKLLTALINSRLKGMKRGYLAFTVFLINVLISCNTQQDEKSKLFTKLHTSKTGIDFSNQLTENETFNILNYLYFFNGGGVAIADLTNDGLPEIFFTANMSSDRLYLNKGDFEFEDISEIAGIDLSEKWSTGVSIADVNGDGWQDIYVCRVGGDYRGFKGENKLYIHQGLSKDGIPQFREAAKEYNLQFSGFSTQAAFFDYDNDGDLDMYLLNHSVHTERSYGPGKKLRIQTDPKAGDKLYKNLLNEGEIGFTEVTKQAGILNSQIGYGLGIALTDLNQDGYTDIYIGNDFHEHDYLYMNNGNGTFTESLQKIANHTSRFTMGVDAADFNNDALPDLITLDMKPEFEEILKASAPEDTYEIFSYKLDFGYNPQFARNNLQLNRGINPTTKKPILSEIGQFTGVDATDWSWSALFCDFDNNGNKDLFISNGIFRRPNDMDYLKHISDDNIKRSLDQGVDSDNLKVITQMPSIPISNYVYSNQSGNTGIHFTDSTKQWGLDEKGFSNGAAYGDLDGDGDQDLVINNLNATASIYRNNTKKSSAKIILNGAKGNPTGIGTKVLIEENGKLLFQENFPVRGFQSAVAQQLIFGLGNETDSIVDNIHVFWPNGKHQKLSNININAPIILAQKNASDSIKISTLLAQRNNKKTFFESFTIQGIDWQHQENKYSDFNAERLMPHLLSTQGPALAIADVDNNGLDDVYFGGAAGQTSTLYLQTKAGAFKASNGDFFDLFKNFEEVDATFFDVDNDNDKDLMVASAGNQLAIGSMLLQDRLYLNDGKGNFTYAQDALPPLFENTSVIRPADFDADGDLDLFIGVRNIPSNYGIPASSYLLENNGRGKFTDITSTVAPALIQTGMLTDAIWLDNDNNYPDLIICSEWKPLQYFKNNKGKFSINLNAGFDDSGWWQSLTANDVDNDGDTDLIAGNLGENSYLYASENEPLHLIINDFDQSGSNDPIIGMYHKGLNGQHQLYPLYGRDAYVDQMSYVRKEFPTYSSFAGKTIDEIFPKQATDSSYTITDLASVVYINDGKNNFQAQKLPSQAQFSPIVTSLVADLNNDGITDLLTAGNLFGVNPHLGQYDASIGEVFLGNNQHSFNYLPNRQHGLWLSGEVKKLAFINMGNQKVLIAAINNQKPLFFTLPVNQ